MVSPRLFRSRWAALLWSGGILWTAYDVAQSAPREPANNASAAHAVAAPSAQTDAMGQPENASDVAMLVNVLGSN